MTSHHSYLIFISILTQHVQCFDITHWKGILSVKLTALLFRRLSQDLVCSKYRSQASTVFMWLFGCAVSNIREFTVIS